MHVYISHASNTECEIPGPHVQSMLTSIAVVAHPRTPYYSSLPRSGQLRHDD